MKNFHRLHYLRKSLLFVNLQRCLPLIDYLPIVRKVYEVMLHSSEKDCTEIYLRLEQFFQRFLETLTLNAKKFFEMMHDI